jgi:hypothetical protein
MNVARTDMKVGNPLYFAMAGAGGADTEINTNTAVYAVAFAEDEYAGGGGNSVYDNSDAYGSGEQRSVYDNSDAYGSGEQRSVYDNAPNPVYDNTDAHGILTPKQVYSTLNTVNRTYAPESRARAASILVDGTADSEQVC